MCLNFAAVQSSLHQNYYHCDTQLKEGYVNEPRPDQNESDSKDRMVKKCLKELKLITYIIKVHFSFWWRNHRNSKVKCVQRSICDILCIQIRNIVDYQFSEVRSQGCKCNQVNRFPLQCLVVVLVRDSGRFQHYHCLLLHSLKKRNGGIVTVYNLICFFFFFLQ